MFRDLKTNKLILNSILKATGNQCSEVRTGVMWSYFLVRVKVFDKTKYGHPRHCPGDSYRRAAPLVPKLEPDVQ